jgi:pyruvate carboxylase subunit B
MKKVKFMCTAFRDGFQSVYGARVLTKDFLPALSEAKDAGITWFEAGGGARYQSLYFYCNEDAFDMMDSFRKTVGDDINLQTLSRGVNVVGLESQSSDVIDLHAKMFKKHGMTTIRNFDALNDVNNLIYSGQCIADAGLKHQVCVTMMELPPGCSGAHNPDFYEMTLKNIIDSGVPFDSVCFKDASGTASPSNVYETVKRARKILPSDTLIHFHTHETAGTSVAQNLAALNGGADAIDLSMAPVSGGTCQPDIATMWHALRGSEFELDIDIDKIMKAEDVFKGCMSKYLKPPEATSVEPTIPWNPMPGGALTANTQMLRDNGILDKYGEISREMGEAVRRGGFATSVTPVSQFYFQQAFNNVMFGKWKKIADGYGKMVLGYFGKTPVAPDPEIVKLAAEQLGLEPTTKTPLEINDADKTKGLEVAKKRLVDDSLPVTDENLFISATCKEKGIAFLKGEAKENIRFVEEQAKQDCSSKNEYNVNIEGRSFDVKLSDGKAEVNGRVFNVDVKEGLSESDLSQPSTSNEMICVKPPMPGVIKEFLVNVGDDVEKDQVVMIIEAMKMEVEVNAPKCGKVSSIDVSIGQQVSADETLAKLS